MGYDDTETTEKGNSGKNDDQNKKEGVDVSQFFNEEHKVDESAQVKRLVNEQKNILGKTELVSFIFCEFSLYLA